jgi:hypothetical protein
MAVLLIAAMAGTFAVRNAYYFLAPQDSTPGGLLVLEGWEPDYVLRRRSKNFGAITTTASS